MIFSKKQKDIVDKLKQKYSVKKLRTFRGMEGDGVNSTLYENGEAVCDVDDDGNGGCLNFGNYEVEEKLEKELKNVGKVKYDETDTMTFTYDAEMFLNDLIDAALEDKTYKRKCKTKTLVITSKCERGQHIEWKYKFSQNVKEQIEKYYKASKENLVEIINERYL
jgi:hypothetical protein